MIVRFCEEMLITCEKIFVDSPFFSNIPEVVDMICTCNINIIYKAEIFSIFLKVTCGLFSSN